MVKTVVLIGKPKAPLIYLVNEIHEYHKIDLLIIEEPERKPNTKQNSFFVRFKQFLKNNFGKHKTTTYSFSQKLLRFLLHRLSQRKIKIHRQLRLDKNNNYYQTIYDGKHKKINVEIEILKVNDINATLAEDAIKEISPLLIIDHGTSLLKNNIISLSEYALNLHWGLSPYYRGVDCTKRALFNWDINNIGVTIHKLSKDIDGGDVFGQKRIKVEAQDNEDRITAKLTFQGTEIIKTAIDLLKDGQTLNFKKQTFEQGFLFKILHMNKNIEVYIEDLDEDKLKFMIKHPSREEVPIIEIKNSKNKNLNR